MRRIRVLVAVAVGVAALAGVGVVTAARTGHCAFCSSFACQSSATCGMSCVCLAGFGDTSGRCYPKPGVVGLAELP